MKNTEPDYNAKKCPYCGGELLKEDAVCVYCGRRIKYRILFGLVKVAVIAAVVLFCVSHKTEILSKARMVSAEVKSAWSYVCRSVGEKIDGLDVVKLFKHWAGNVDDMIKDTTGEVKREQ